MSNDEWEQDEPPTNILGKIKLFLLPKRKKKSKLIEETKPVDVTVLPVSDPEKVIEVTTEIKSESETKVEVEETPSKEETKPSKKQKGKKIKQPKSEDDWVADPKTKKKMFQPDLGRGLPGNLMVKRGVATILFFIYLLLLIYVVKFELFSTVICIASIIIILDYLAITRGRLEDWE
jgi:uncharacterized membrane protein